MVLTVTPFVFLSTTHSFNDFRCAVERTVAREEGNLGCCCRGARTRRGPSCADRGEANERICSAPDPQCTAVAAEDFA